MKTFRLPSVRLTRGLLLTWGCLLAAGLTPVGAQEGNVKTPEHRHGMDLAVRAADQPRFTDDTKKFGVEVYLDPNTNKTIFITETGSVAAVPSSNYDGEKSKAPEWKHGVNLRVRPAGKPNFDDMTPRFGVEMFHDLPTNTVLFITETGSLAAVPFTPEMTFSKKDPVWKHAMNLSARKAGQKSFGPDTKKYGVEVFHDPNTNCLIYISETGSIAVTPGTAETAQTVKTPEFKQGADVMVREGGKPDFNEMTPRVGYEMFLDTNANQLVAISEKGALALVGGTSLKEEARGKAPPWKHGLDLRVRKSGGSSWDEAAKYGIECYSDEATGALVYICQTGTLTIVK